MQVFLRSPSLVVDRDTIFKVTRNRTFPVYLANLESTVTLGPQSSGGSGGAYRFRNPVGFMSHIERRAAAYAAAYETDAFLDHLATHPNTPPFLARALIKKLTTSNPSPRYVRVVADAFIRGDCAAASGGGLTFSAQYGDLGAAVACILLDREARSATLEADPSHGGLREPLLKVIHLMRAMEYRSYDQREIYLQTLGLDLGQQPYGAASPPSPRRPMPPNPLLPSSRSPGPCSCTFSQSCRRSSTSCPLQPEP